MTTVSRVGTIKLSLWYQESVHTGCKESQFYSLPLEQAVATIFDKIKWNSKPLSPKSRMKPCEGQKRAIFPSLLLGGGEVKVFHLFCPRL